jgi:hypothetical protein
MPNQWYVGYVDGRSPIMNFQHPNASASKANARNFQCNEIFFEAFGAGSLYAAFRNGSESIKILKRKNRVRKIYDWR